MVSYCTCRHNYLYRSVNLNMAVHLIFKFYKDFSCSNCHIINTRQLFKLSSYHHLSAVQTVIISTTVSCSNCHHINTCQLFKLSSYQHLSAVQTVIISTPFSCSNCHDINTRHFEHKTTHSQIREGSANLTILSVAKTVQCR
jgi:hypothetical protein